MLWIAPSEKDTDNAALVRRFESQVEPMGKQMLALQRQIQNLRRTRALLLPRLLSGQVELATGKIVSLNMLVSTNAETALIMKLKLVNFTK